MTRSPRYCVFHYGFLLGVGLGWLPSLIVAFLVGLLWPLALIGAVVYFLFFRWWRAARPRA